MDRKTLRIQLAHAFNNFAYCLQNIEEDRQMWREHVFDYMRRLNEFDQKEGKGNDPLPHKYHEALIRDTQRE